MPKLFVNPKYADGMDFTVYVVVDKSKRQNLV